MAEEGALTHKTEKVEHERQSMLYHGRGLFDIDMPFDPFHEGGRFPSPDEIRGLGVETQNVWRIVELLVEPSLTHIAP